MARYMPDFPVGNGQFENLNPVPIVEYMEPASSRTQSIEEQVKNQVELQLSSRSAFEDDDDEDDFFMDDDEYEVPEDEWPDYAKEASHVDKKAETVKVSDSNSTDRKSEKSPQDVGSDLAATTEAAGAAEGVSK